MAPLCLLLPFPTAGITVRAEEPHVRDGLQVTLGVLRPGLDGGDARELAHLARLNLDRPAARAAFAEASGIDAALLLTVRERVLEWMPPATTANAADGVEIDEETERQAEDLLGSVSLLDDAGTTVAELGYAGDLWLPKVIFLVLLSRLLRRPINLVVLGPSSAGKSFVVSLVVCLCPAEAVYLLNGMSERVLAYTEADLKHKVLIIGEASALQQDGIGASLLRSISWEGRVVYEFVEKTAKGMAVRRVEKEGPTGFITTTTTGVEHELETRTLTVQVPDTEAVTQTIIAATADRAAGIAGEEPDLRPWIAAQRWLASKGVREVVVPFAPRIAPHFPSKQVRARRDFPQLVSLIETHAFLHQQQRERDAAGRIVANERDYRAIHALAGPIFGAIAAGGVTKTVRQTVAAVASLLGGLRDPDSKTVTVLQVAGALRVDKSVASRRVTAALKGQWLVNEEDRRGRPLRVRLGDALPDESPALPSPDLVFPTDPARNRATVQPVAENPASDHEKRGCTDGCTIAPPDIDPTETGAAVADRLQDPVQPQNPRHDAENEVTERSGCTVAAVAAVAGGMREETISLPLAATPEGRATWTFPANR
jgi:hypothetical protein